MRVVVVVVVIISSNGCHGTPGGTARLCARKRWILHHHGATAVGGFARVPIVWSFDRRLVVRSTWDLYRQASALSLYNKNPVDYESADENRRSNDDNKASRAQSGTALTIPVRGHRCIIAT